MAAWEDVSSDREASNFEGAFIELVWGFFGQFLVGDQRKTRALSLNSQLRGAFWTVFSGRPKAKLRSHPFCCGRDPWSLADFTEACSRRDPHRLLFAGCRECLRSLSRVTSTLRVPPAPGARWRQQAACCSTELRGKRPSIPPSRPLATIPEVGPN